jgi:hypothetical protein
MPKSQLFVKYHWHQIILVLVVAVAAVSLNVIDEDILHKKKPVGNILGETVVNNEQANDEQATKVILTYQAGLKKELGEYFVQRVTVENNKDEWLKLIEESQAKILNLGVPDGYKDLQIKVITNFDLEKAALKQNEPTKKETANNNWGNILKQFFWLNN